MRQAIDSDGETQISRFRHGLLLRMVVFAGGSLRLSDVKGDRRALPVGIDVEIGGGRGNLGNLMPGHTAPISGVLSALNTVNRFRE
jgi:hypothetical protein